VNNLGATPTMELAIVARRALEVLEKRGVAVERVYLGTFLSALEMAGVSLSVLRVDDARLARLDAATDAPAWPCASAPRRRDRRTERAGAAVSPAPLTVQPPRTALGRAIGRGIEAATAALVAAAPQLTALDQVVGDGDLGISLARGAEALREALPSYPLDD